MSLTKLQKEINAISKLNLISGELYLSVDTTAKNYKELDEISDMVLNNLIIPNGFERTENLIYKKGLKIYISFTKK